MEPYASIYTNCDPENVDKIPVSTLINFMEPYIYKNRSALDALHQLLDPNKTNPTIERQTFYNIMKKWQETFNAEGKSELELQSSNSFPLSQSTPRQSLDPDFILKIPQEVHEMSGIVSNDQNSIGLDRIGLEEELKQMKHYLNRVTHELEAAKQQLISAEEENGALINELEAAKNKMKM